MTGRLVCFDVGERRIGIAASDLLGITAQPVETYTRTGKIEEDYQYLAKILRDQEAVKLVVGLPKNMNNTLASSAGDPGIHRRIPALSARRLSHRLDR